MRVSVRDKFWLIVFCREQISLQLIRKAWLNFSISSESREKDCDLLPYILCVCVCVWYFREINSLAVRRLTAVNNETRSVNGRLEVARRPRNNDAERIGRAVRWAACRKNNIEIRV